jgi:diguanylate cyclase (GGDEF)-like protein
MHLPSRRVLFQSAKVAALTTVFTMSISVGIRAFLGIEADEVTLAIRLVMPFVTAFPIALVYFSKLDALEQSYGALLRNSTELARQAMVDPMTGLLNRRAFIPQFELATGHSVDGVFLIADVDLLKQVNDKFGHVVGDHVIMAVAQAIAVVLPKESIVARIGGDEFCAYVPNASHEQALHWQAEIDRQVKLAFHRVSKLDGDLASVSVGIMQTRPQLDFVTALSTADLGLYGAKRERGGAQDAGKT